MLSVLTCITRGFQYFARLDGFNYQFTTINSKILFLLPGHKEWYPLVCKDYYTLLIAHVLTKEWYPLMSLFSCFKMFPWLNFSFEYPFFQTKSKLQEFINYIKREKVVILEELGAHFDIRTQVRVCKTVWKRQRQKYIKDTFTLSLSS